MPVIPALWEAEAGGSRGQEIKTILVNHGETSSLLKIQKKNQLGMVARACNLSYSGGWVAGEDVTCKWEAQLPKCQGSDFSMETEILDFLCKALVLLKL